MRLSHIKMAGDGFSLPSNSIGWFGHHQTNTNINNSIISSTSPKPNINIPNPSAKKKRNLPGTPGKFYMYMYIKQFPGKF